MDRASSIISKVLRKRGLQEHAEGALVVIRAQRWLNERLQLPPGTVTVRSYKEETLMIDCTHSVAVQECQASIGDLTSYLRSDCDFLGSVNVRVSRA